MREKSRLFPVEKQIHARRRTANKDIGKVSSFSFDPICPRNSLCAQTGNKFIRIEGIISTFSSERARERERERV